MPLRKKNPGRAIHNSGFIVEEFGRLALSPSQIKEQNMLTESKHLPCYDSREIIYPRKNGDGWWNSTRLIEQVLYFDILLSSSLTIIFAGEESHSAV
jgi:hypothetical protein